LNLLAPRLAAALAAALFAMQPLADRSSAGKARWMEKCPNGTCGNRTRRRHQAKPRKRLKPKEDPPAPIRNRQGLNRFLGILERRGPVGTSSRDASREELPLRPEASSDASSPIQTIRNPSAADLAAAHRSLIPVAQSCRRHSRVLSGLRQPSQATP